MQIIPIIIRKVKNESDNPDKACEMINDIDDTATYEEALRTMLDGYYLENDTNSIESLEKSIDSRGEEILENCENAAEERSTDETELGYMSGEVLAVVKKGIAQEDIPPLFEDGRTNVTAISNYTDGKNRKRVGCRDPAYGIVGNYQKTQSLKQSCVELLGNRNQRLNLHSNKQ